MRWQVAHSLAHTRLARVSIALPLRGHCRRDHPLSADNIRVTCLECNREGARLRQRLVRIRETLDHHVRTCPSCQVPGECRERAALEQRLNQRRRALRAWRLLADLEVQD